MLSPSLKTPARSPSRIKVTRGGTAPLGHQSLTRSSAASTASTATVSDCPTSPLLATNVLEVGVDLPFLIFVHKAKPRYIRGNIYDKFPDFFRMGI